jgi:hypothetical protein
MYRRKLRSRARDKLSISEKMFRRCGDGYESDQIQAKARVIRPDAVDSSIKRWLFGSKQRPKVLDRPINERHLGITTRSRREIIVGGASGLRRDTG